MTFQRICSTNYFKFSSFFLASRAALVHLGEQSITELSENIVSCAPGEPKFLRSELKFSFFDFDFFFPFLYFSLLLPKAPWNFILFFLVFSTVAQTFFSFASNKSLYFDFSSAFADERSKRKTRAKKRRKNKRKNHISARLVYFAPHNHFLLNFFLCHFHEKRKKKKAFFFFDESSLSLYPVALNYVIAHTIHHFAYIIETAHKSYTDTQMRISFFFFLSFSLWSSLMKIDSNFTSRFFFLLFFLKFSLDFFFFTLSLQTYTNKQPHNLYLAKFAPAAFDWLLRWRPRVRLMELAVLVGLF